MLLVAWRPVVFVRVGTPEEARKLAQIPRRSRQPIRMRWVMVMARAQQPGRHGADQNWPDAIAGQCVPAESALVRDEQDRNANGNQNWFVLLVYVHNVDVVDTWNTTGLAGRGSLVYTITDVLGPEDHAFTFGSPRAEPALWPYPTPSCARW
ncbi:hypothetical protein GZH49_38780 [Nocardia terpenica]|uniref:hypothetical protein n=1 Tax=Nocardia terpenica TaxID=455432 RepID=UPI002FE0E9E6